MSRRIVCCNLLPDNYRDKLQANDFVIHYHFLAGTWKRQNHRSPAEILWELMLAISDRLVTGEYSGRINLVMMSVTMVLLRIGNGGAANTGAAIVPQSTIGTRYGNSVSTAWTPPKPTTKLGLNCLVTAENQRERPIQNFGIDPVSSIRTSIADTVFADPVSKTPIFRNEKRGLNIQFWVEYPSDVRADTRADFAAQTFSPHCSERRKIFLFLR